jgi:hypothetical protein
VPRQQGRYAPVLTACRLCLAPRPCAAAAAVFLQALCHTLVRALPCCCPPSGTPPRSRTSQEPSSGQ